MFRKACAIAAEFTFPMVLSRKTVGGVCSSSIGTFVVVNSEGWIVTAGHILNQWTKLVGTTAATKAAIQARDAIKSEPNLTNKERAKKLSSAPQVGKDDTEQCSLWMGFPDATVRLTNMMFYDVAVPDWGEVADFGIGQLQPFDPAWVKTYPIFKDPTKEFEPGKSLCKLGFPFHQFQPTWDAGTSGFRLPDGALPMPRFPIEGIFTRVTEIKIDGKEQPPMPIRYVETSSPGLRGQSGGPTFDEQGTIWAIQAKTSHLPLGFAGPSQFLHVGLGAHPDMMFPMMNEAKIKFNISDY